MQQILELGSGKVAHKHQIDGVDIVLRHIAMSQFVIILSSAWDPGAVQEV